MPELPEVETIAKSLSASLPGLVIEKVEVLNSQVIAAPGSGEFCRLVAGRKILGLSRRGKYLLMSLSGDLVLAVHLRMTGRLIHTGPGEPLARHTHLIFFLQNGTQLRYADTRRFGRLWLLAPGSLSTHPGIGSLGVEPLSPQFTPAYLAGALAGRRTRLKSLLLDQRVVAGLGNIYADEALHRAGLHPLRPACTLTGEEVEALHAAIREVLREGIAARGTTVRDYTDGRGQAGTFQEKLRVYRRQGQPCPRCGKPIARLVLGGRSSYFCPGCQR
ncbi:bifunctional DNA-formamidopyrimidine glycosylase/DNA-(apurinic or apyrimidinic site) lyase [Desulfovirgula thermocuniculi]|uniref:bifunctional DNA-formamidopyrimidine glycosylase/DNA-(apurinic or apyrimidinic site) lyase n=1 Tax=Desulfovirgula thermocuniculi TaxID=348842 RepID=UPI0004281739|nr:bifunctional DNA-formamidopyrimidine glycosylase/DNA-(apurinic or apyrimidinic site) lyase [Desulfovirgula thermocuniculi]